MIISAGVVVADHAAFKIERTARTNQYAACRSRSHSVTARNFTGGIEYKIGIRALFVCMIGQFSVCIQNGSASARRGVTVFYGKSRPVAHGNDSAVGRSALHIAVKFIAVEVDDNVRTCGQPQSAVVIRRIVQKSARIKICCIVCGHRTAERADVRSKIPVKFPHPVAVVQHKGFGGAFRNALLNHFRPTIRIAVFIGIERYFMF